MPQPPGEDTARRLARAVLGAAGTDVYPAHPGATTGAGHFTWWAGRAHVLRCAHDADASARLDRERAVRDLVRPHTRAAVASSAGHGTWAAALAYTVDTRLPGAFGDRGTVSPGGEADLADLLGGLRAVPAAQAAMLGLPAAPARPLERLRASAVRAARALADEGEFGPARFAPLGGRALAQLAAPPGGVLVHRALTGRHLGLTGDGRLGGVLHWGDAALGDPAEDIAGLAAALGAPAAVRAATLAGYGARQCLRGLWLARCDAVVRFAAALRTAGADAAAGGKDGALSALREGMWRAWEPILLERLTGEDPGDAAPAAR
ncbi:phosphotransferase [Streptomyces sp. NPDC050560]|uniref:phosphotransferase n=1 Tax=Streptomyces sp. NPDC050560 TaxID=3365630 RepID=UPI0037A71DD9